MKKVKISDIGQIVTGNTPSKKNEKFYNSPDIIFTKPNDISSGNEVTNINSGKSFISEEARSKTRIVPKGSVLVTCIGIIGKIGIVEKSEIALNQQINAIIPDEKTCSRYLAYLLLYNKKRLTAIANAPVVPIINKTQFSNFEVDFHDNLTTQQKISNTLDLAAGLVAKRKEQLAEMDRLVQSAYAKSIRSNPVNAIFISDVVKKISTGKSYASEEDGNYKVLKTSAVSYGHFDGRQYKNLPPEYIPPSEHFVRKGDILVSRMNTNELVGAAAYVWEEHDNLTLPDRLWKLHLKDNVNPIFLWKTMQESYFKNLVRNNASGTSGSMKNISQKDFLSLKIMLPDIVVQQKIAAIVKEIESQKKVMRQSLTEMEKNFNTLMQRAFKGELFPE